MQKAFQKGRGLWAHSLLDALEGLSAEQAAWKPQGQKTRSIWEIVSHVTFWKDALRQRLEGGPWADTSEHEEKGWPPVREISEKAWANTLEELKRSHEALVQAVSKLKDEQLEKPFPDEEEPIGEHLFGLIAHDGYHTGQILAMRQLQGIGL
jgi:uncharacterized damage-inducible protein DinB